MNRRKKGLNQYFVNLFCFISCDKCLHNYQQILVQYMQRNELINLAFGSCGLQNFFSSNLLQDCGKGKKETT